MIVDTSAIVAILQNEPEALRYVTAMNDARDVFVSAATRVELSFVVEGRKGDQGRQDLEALLATFNVQIIPVSAVHAELAIDAFRRFGKGRHPAALNIGDCFSYALASATGLPLLFKGSDFSATDVKAAV